MSAPRLSVEESNKAARAHWVNDLVEVHAETVTAPPCHTSTSLLTVIPEDGTIDVASTPSIPEEEPWDPPSASSSFRLSGSLGSSPAGSVKDWTSIETRLECFAKDLETSILSKALPSEAPHTASI
eukprot:scaffold1824_cov48-Prasinocladus_malaysianus.AAC.1